MLFGGCGNDLARGRRAECSLLMLTDVARIARLIRWHGVGVSGQGSPRRDRLCWSAFHCPSEPAAKFTLEDACGEPVRRSVDRVGNLLPWSRTTSQISPPDCRKTDVAAFSPNLTRSESDQATSSTCKILPVAEHELSLKEAGATRVVIQAALLLPLQTACVDSELDRRLGKIVTIGSAATHRHLGDKQPDEQIEQAEYCVNHVDWHGAIPVTRFANRHFLVGIVPASLMMMTSVSVQVLSDKLWLTRFSMANRYILCNPSRRT